MIIIKKIKKYAHFVVSFAIGALLGTSLLEMIPEALEHSPAEKVLAMVITGVIIFFILEKFLHWHHCHGHKHKHDKERPKTFAMDRVNGGRNKN